MNAFDRLRRANPNPTRPVEGKPTAQEMLAAIREGEVGRRSPAPERPSPWRRGLLVAAAAAIVVLVVAVPILLFLNAGDEEPPVVTEPPTPTTVPATTVPATTTPPSTTPATTVPAVLDAATQALVDTFVATYNAGDVDAFAAFLHPEFERLVTVDRDPRPPLLETVFALYEVDAALNTEITVDCRPGAADAFCTVTRFDDLHRVLGIPPSDDYAWGLTFEDGLLRSWAETRPTIPDSAYEVDVVQPFRDWVIANTELDGETFENLYTSGNAQTWVPRDGIVEDLVALVAEWAADLGVTLEG